MKEKEGEEAEREGGNTNGRKCEENKTRNKKRKECGKQWGTAEPYQYLSVQYLPSTACHLFLLSLLLIQAYL